MVTLSREKIIGIMCLFFFAAFDSINPHEIPDTFFPNFSPIKFYSCEYFQIQMKFLLNYFKRVSKEIPKGNLIIHRQVLTKEMKPKWELSNKPIKKIIIESQGKIEDSSALLHVDFANQYIGGGVLNGGRVQEEILFLNKPELIVTLLFCPKMEENEAIVITGAERFSKEEGYHQTLNFLENFVDKSERFIDGTLKTKIVAIDAFISFSKDDQFLLSNFFRDLNKAYIGFIDTTQQDHKNLSLIATGNWGCGGK
jgi:poly(ADP-ribose) glycohydrolase